MKPSVFLILRLTLAISMFGHGVVRIPKLVTFSTGMMNLFQNTFLPPSVVYWYANILSVCELFIGILLFLGLFTRQTLISGCILLLSLVFGTTLIEKWDSMPTQMLHIIFFAVLLQFVENDTYSLSAYLRKSKQ